jgi:hypothetical protein
MAILTPTVERSEALPNKMTVYKYTSTANTDTFNLDIFASKQVAIQAT